MRGLVAEHIADRVAACIRVRVAACIRALEAAYTLALEVGFTLDQVVGSTLGLVGDYTQVLKVASTAALAAECIPGTAITHIEATYRLGLYSLTILRHTECRI